jgi:hypothetical protein
MKVTGSEVLAPWSANSLYFWKGFDFLIQNSFFDIRFIGVSLLIRQAASAASGWADT